MEDVDMVDRWRMWTWWIGGECGHGGLVDDVNMVGTADMAGLVDTVDLALLIIKSA